jgi:hypothetical protein
MFLQNAIIVATWTFDADVFSAATDRRTGTLDTRTVNASAILLKKAIVVATSRTVDADADAFSAGAGAILLKKAIVVPTSRTVDADADAFSAGASFEVTRSVGSHVVSTEMKLNGRINKTHVC